MYLKGIVRRRKGSVGRRLWSPRQSGKARGVSCKKGDLKKSERFEKGPSHMRRRERYRLPLYTFLN